jgi:ParB-like chromosome segregation protein Spo0J
MPIIDGDSNQAHLQRIEGYMKSITEILAKKDLDTIGLSNQFNNLVEQYDMTQKQIADIFGKSEAWVCQIRRLKKLPERVQQLVKERKVTLLEAQKILQIKNGKEQIPLAELCAQGLSSKDLEAQIKKLTESPTLDEPKIKLILRESSKQIQPTEIQANPFKNAIIAIESALEKEENKFTIKNQIVGCVSTMLKDTDVCDGNCDSCQNYDKCMNILQAFFNFGIKSFLVR